MSVLTEEEIKRRLENITKQYIDLYDDIDNEINSYINKYFINITKSAFKLFNYHAISRSVLNHSDKEIYLNSKKIIANYKAILKTYDDMEGYYSDCYALQLVNEMVSNVREQYNIFCMQVDYKQNPIQDEKNEIIDKYALNLADTISSIQKEFERNYLSKVIENLKKVDKNDYESQFNIIKNVKNNYKLDVIFSSSVKNLRECILELDALEKREVTNKYYMFLKFQQQLLSEIIKNQIIEIDKEVGNEMYDEGIKIFITLIINQILEVYDFTEHSVDSVERLYRISPLNQNADIEYKNYEVNFDNYINKEKKVSLDIFEINDKLEEIDNIKKEGYDLIRGLVKELKNPINQNSIYNQVKRNYKATINITNEFLDKLSKLNIYVDSNRQLLKVSDEFEIIEGIQETMDIKIKVLSKSSELLQTELETNIEELNYNVENLKITINEKALDIYFKNLRKINIKTYIDKYVESLLKSKQCVIDSSKLEVDIDEIEKAIVKKLFEYKKETLFYEISTFDEVLYYSIEKIRQSENLNVKKYIIFIDDIKEKMFKTLEKNDVIIIKPKAHDKFNSKEHKVLIAEEKEGFNKGEVIKVNTVGYKEFDTVILKANVIAAR